MIIAYLGFFMLIGVGVWFWWFLQQPLLDALARVQAMTPGAIPLDEAVFIQRFIYWFPALMIIGGVIWVLVFTQRTEPEGFYA